MPSRRPYVSWPQRVLLTDVSEGLIEQIPPGHEWNSGLLPFDMHLVGGMKVTNRIWQMQRKGWVVLPDDSTVWALTDHGRQALEYAVALHSGQHVQEAAA